MRGEEKQTKLDELTMALTVAANEWASGHGWGIKSQLDVNQDVVYFLIVHPDKSVVAHYMPRENAILILKGVLQSISYICRQITNYSLNFGVVNTDKAVVVVLPDNTNIALTLQEEDGSVYIVTEIENKRELHTPEEATRLLTNIIELYICMEAATDDE
jgi:hypothetical protein